MTALSYELLTTVLIESERPISTNELLATVLMQKYHSFQHINYLLPSTEMPGPWRLCDTRWVIKRPDVSISTEMPGPWRRRLLIRLHQLLPVSISTEMPGPW